MITKAFKEASQALWEYLEDEKTVQVIAHDDADGLSAGGILHKALIREGHGVQTRVFKQLDKEVIGELSKEGRDVMIFTDLGSGQLGEIGENLPEKHKVIILDHHQIKGEVAHENLHHVNPLNHDIDGAREVSGAGMAYLFSRAFNKANMDLAALAVVGALGDVQDATGELIGLNKEIVEDGIKARVLRKEKDLRLWGRQTRPLYKAIEYTTEPFLPGLSGNESSCIQFFNDIDVPIKKDGELIKLADLTEEERKRLVTALILKMIEHGIEAKSAESIVGEVYTILNEEKRTKLRDAKEYATLLNSCGRKEKYSIGLGIALGDRGKLYKTAMSLQEAHKKYLSSCYRWISKNTDRIEDNEEVYSLHARDEIDENVIGTVTSMVLNSKILNEIKPVISFVETKDGRIKVSSRATRELIEKGVNLGKAMMYAAENTGGEGGGHDVAAGAKIEKGQEGKFLRHVKEKVREQIHEVKG